MINAATYAVAAVNGAFDANIVTQRLPSFRNTRATVFIAIDCEFA